MGYSAHELRAKWEENGRSNRLDRARRPAADRTANSPAALYENVEKRMRHLAEVLALLHKIYLENEELYGDRFLSFVGNEVVRMWPWLDYPFASDAALQKTAQCELGVSLVGCDKERMPAIAGEYLRYEHWTPISFFRDVFKLSPEPICKEVFEDLLRENYRVVWVTREEDEKLDAELRAHRSREAYENFGIHISDPLWSELRARKR